MVFTVCPGWTGTCATSWGQWKIWPSSWVVLQMIRGAMIKGQFRLMKPKQVYKCSNSHYNSLFVRFLYNICSRFAILYMHLLHCNVLKVHDYYGKSQSQAINQRFLNSKWTLVYGSTTTYFCNLLWVLFFLHKNQWLIVIMPISNTYTQVAFHFLQLVFVCTWCLVFASFHANVKTTD